MTLRELAQAGGIRVGAAVNDVALATGEVLHADRVVLAAGTWSGPLAATAGVDVPMQPARG